VSLKTILGYAAVALVLFWVIAAPASAAHLMDNVGNFLTTAASALSHFFTSV
jgi:hypothetical protein